MSEFIWTERAKEQLRAIEREQAIEILHALTDYAASGKGQIKKLKGSGDLRWRVGDYRVRFEVVEKDTDGILRVRHRKEASATALT